MTVNDVNNMGRATNATNKECDDADIATGALQVGTGPVANR
ncbi:hypothetical protein [Aeromicrobium sp.]|nr:hypothetical protein [Aeromicrobium sp.]